MKPQVCSDRLITRALFIGFVLFCQVSIIMGQDDANAESPSDSPDADADEDVSSESDNTTAVEIDISGGNLNSLPAVARDALVKSWENLFSGSISEIPLLSILEGVNNAPGEERLVALRVLELIDSNMDGKISKEEFASTYGTAISTPDQAIELLFKAYDYDLDGYISIYETLVTSLTLEGININLHDSWMNALFSIKEKDVNNDSVLDLHEFMMHVVLELLYGLAESDLKRPKKGEEQPQPTE